MKSFRLGIILALTSASLFAETTVTICNKNTDRKIYAAHLRDVGGGSGWQSNGWYEVDATKCSAVDVGNYTGKLFLYAEDEFGQMHWDGNGTAFCVNKTDAFTINNADTAPCTDATLKKVNSVELNVVSGNQEWDVSANASLLNFCNKNTGFPLYVALATTTNGTWNSQGWYQIPANQCAAVSVGAYTGDVNYHAEYQTVSYGQGPFQFCVNKTNSFNYPNADQASLCTGSDQKMVLADKVTAALGETTINLDAVVENTTLRLCNKTTNSPIEAAVAINSATAGQLTSAGWYALNASQCQDLNLGTYTGNSYVYAEYNGGQLIWGTGPQNICVNRTQAFNIQDAGNATACNQSTANKMVPTYEFTLNAGMNEWDFNP